MYERNARVLQIKNGLTSEQGQPKVISIEVQQ